MRQLAYAALWVILQLCRPLGYQQCLNKQKVTPVSCHKLIGLITSLERGPASSKVSILQGCPSCGLAEINTKQESPRRNKMKTTLPLLKRKQECWVAFATHLV